MMTNRMALSHSSDLSATCLNFFVSIHHKTTVFSPSRQQYRAIILRNFHSYFSNIKFFNFMQAHTFDAFARQLFSHRRVPRHQAGGTTLITMLFAFAVSSCGGGGASTNPGASVPIAPATPAIPASPVPTVAHGNWVVMGSSTAAGIGVSTGKGWVALLQAEWASTGSVLINIAKGGIGTYEGLSSTSSPVVNRPLPDVATNIDQALAKKPVLLIIAFPSNDTASGYSVDETVNNLLAIRAKALAVSVPVVVLSTQPRDLAPSQLSQLRDIDERMVKQVGACFVAIRAKLAGPDNKLAPNYDSGDRAHPNALGHVLIADAVDNVLRSDACVHLSP